MKHYIYLLFLLAFLQKGNTQSTPQYTQFFFNKVMYNPAYAGSKEVMSLLAHYRHQWQGIEGAPRTATVTMQTPFFKNRCGLGLSIVSEEVALMRNNTLKMAYAYRIPFKNNRSTLSFGLQGTLENNSFDWKNASPITAADDLLQGRDQNALGGNFGVGIYYTSSLFYVGASVPYLLNQSGLYNAVLDLDQTSSSRNYYLMSGLLLNLNNNIVLKPAVLISHNATAPLEVDLNLSALLANTVWIGFTYRTMESIDAVLQYQFNRRWKVGFAMDYTLTELSSYTPGSAEIMVEHLFDRDKDRLKNLRFF